MSFVANDALVKFASETLPAWQIMAVRGLCASVLLVSWCVAVRTSLRLQDFADRGVLLRSLADAAASISYVAAIAHLALANATAIAMATPLVLGVLAAVVLGEAMPARRWVAIGAGFVGVLLVVQPAGHSFNAWSVVALASTFFIACRDLVTRRVRRSIPSLQVTLASVLLITALCIAWGGAQPWQPIGLSDFVAILAAAAFMCCGYVFLVVAFREGELSVVSPFRYAAVPCSAAVGYVVWGDVPNALAWTGIVVLIVSGVYLVRSHQSG